jgi:hypothetical protein
MELLCCKFDWKFGTVIRSIATLELDRIALWNPNQRSIRRLRLSTSEDAPLKTAACKPYGTCGLCCFSFASASQSSLRTISLPVSCISEPIGQYQISGSGLTFRNVTEKPLFSEQNIWRGDRDHQLILPMNWLLDALEVFGNRPWKLAIFVSGWTHEGSEGKPTKPLCEFVCNVGHILAPHGRENTHCNWMSFKIFYVSRKANPAIEAAINCRGQEPTLGCEFSRHFITDA